MTVDIRRLTIADGLEAPGKLALARLPPTGDAAVAEEVRRILDAVRARGDEAVIEAVRRFEWDCPGAAALAVEPRRIGEALTTVGGELERALGEAAASIRRFHERQRPPSCEELHDGGMRAGLRAIPLDAVGLYVPGGRASYPSTLLMLAIPAQVASVRRIAVATPTGRDGSPSPQVLAAAAVLGLQEIYAVGGAAAIGALAYGTSTIPRVDKILGPGSVWVTEAKRQVFGAVGIDSLAGPTELVILSDGSAPAAYVAADMLAQAEHDPLASAILLTTDATEADRVLPEIERQLRGSPRDAIQRESLACRGALLTCASREVACAAARFLAPEHLEVLASDPGEWATLVPTAAAVFLGPFSPEAAGDYGAGPNHCLPTGGTARFSSPVGVWDFYRLQSYLELDREALRDRARFMEPLARAEQLDAHAASLRVRGDMRPEQPSR